MKKLRNLLTAVLLACLAIPALATTWTWKTYALNANGSGLGSYMLSSVKDMVWTPPTTFTVPACSVHGAYFVGAADGGEKFFRMLMDARSRAIQRGASTIQVAVLVPDDICKFNYPTFSTLEVFE
jgi:hypothetical protein